MAYGGFMSSCCITHCDWHLVSGIRRARRGRQEEVRTSLGSDGNHLLSCNYWTTVNNVSNYHFSKQNMKITFPMAASQCRDKHANTKRSLHMESQTWSHRKSCVSPFHECCQTRVTRTLHTNGPCALLGGFNEASWRQQAGSHRTITMSLIIGAVQQSERIQTPVVCSYTKIIYIHFSGLYTPLWWRDKGTLSLAGRQSQRTWESIRAWVRCSWTPCKATLHHRRQTFLISTLSNGNFWFCTLSTLTWSSSPLEYEQCVFRWLLSLPTACGVYVEEKKVGSGRPAEIQPRNIRGTGEKRVIRLQGSTATAGATVMIRASRSFVNIGGVAWFQFRTHPTLYSIRTSVNRAQTQFHILLNPDIIRFYILQLKQLNAVNREALHLRRHGNNHTTTLDSSPVSQCNMYDTLGCVYFFIQSSFLRHLFPRLYLFFL